MNLTEARTILRRWREENVRKSQSVVDIYETVVGPKIHKLGDEKYLVLEQVTVAAFDCHRMELARQCLGQLSNAFPGSIRVRLLHVLGLQAAENYDVAKDVLDSIIQADPTNPLPKKHEIAMFIALGKNQLAIRMLTEYLKRFMADQEAWQELSSLYLIEQDYAKAAFCAEELILHDPHSHLLHQYLAEIRYTQGGFENLELARTHYCAAIKLNPNNMRALYGLLLTVTNIIGSPKCTATKRKEATKLQTWVSKLIQNRYKNVSGNKDVKAVEGLFSSLQISSVSSSSSLSGSKSTSPRALKDKNSDSL
ncbi:unnamed protein product [Bemisia tabaci]|uniref:ER membrane protein complex subunit 2 n=1 Tax=Bemisia tabaci TaxID=7038 RepID=A0A9P0G4S1_BEMTA|nr:unnamed protein product [Bemisia tabaci]